MKTKASLLCAVDVGNTRTKFCIWREQDEDVPAFEFVDGSNTYETTMEWLFNLPIGNAQTVNWIISSVNSYKSDFLKENIHKSRPHDVVRMISLVDIPLTVHYDFPERLGLDRAIAAYAGINLIGLGRPFLVIDVGTAATIDYIDSQGVFRGGAILPGPRLAAEALQTKTANLPILEDPEKADLTFKMNNGRSEVLTYPATETHNAIRLGVVFTLIGAIVSFLWKTRRAIIEKNEDPSQLSLLLAGGDGHFTKCNLEDYFNDMDAALEFTVPRPEIIVEPRLVLLGLKTLAASKSFIWE